MKRTVGLLKKSEQNHISEPPNYDFVIHLYMLYDNPTLYL